MFISNIPLSVSPLAAQSAQSRGIVAAMKILMLFSVALKCKIQLIGRSYSKTCFYFVASDIHSPHYVNYSGKYQIIVYLFIAIILFIFWEKRLKHVRPFLLPYNAYNITSAHGVKVMTIRYETLGKKQQLILQTCC